MKYFINPTQILGQELHWLIVLVVISSIKQKEIYVNYARTPAYLNMICAWQTEECSVATGKEYGKMLEIFSKFLIVWGITIALSLLLISLAVLFYVFSSDRREYINERYGLKGFFKNVRECGRDNLIWLTLLIPFLNVIMGLIFLFVFCTDVGDYL